MTDTPKKVWVIQKTVKNIGDMNACLGVASRICDNPVLHSVEDIEAAGGPNQWLIQRNGNQPLKSRDAFPDVVISSHKASTSIPYVTDIKRLSGGHTFLIQLRDPGERFNEFDLIANPSHAPKIYGPNVIETVGIAHNITSHTLKKGREAWQEELSMFDGYKKIAVLVGGDVPYFLEETGGGKFLIEDAVALGEKLNNEFKGKNIALFLINSHRTPEAAWHALREKITDVPTFVHDYKLDAAKGNPYHGLLDASDVIIPTADSMSMCSEACYPGKPVYIAGMDFTNVRSDHRRYAEQLIINGHARPLERIDEPWLARPTFLDTAGVIAEEAMRRIKQKQVGAVRGA